MIEQQNHKRAFETYYAMGASRSLVRLAKKLGVARNTAKSWSRAFGWQDRIAERDREVTRVMEAESIREAVDTRKRNRQLLQLALVQIAKQLAEGRVKATMGDLDRLIRLEQFLDGQADSRQEVIARDLEGKSTEELRGMLQREIAELQTLAGQEVN